MPLTPSTKNFEPPKDSTAAVLMEKSDAVIAEWLNRMRQTIPAAKNEREPILIDTLPAFLENLAEALAPNYPREIATEGTTLATEHGGERARMTRISPPDLVREFQLLRDVLFDVLGAETPLSVKDSRVIIKSIDLAMSQSLTAYFLVYEGLREQLSNTLTHDLRSPLSAIKVSAELILRSPKNIEKNSILASRITENVVRIDRMVEDLLDASRVRFGEKIQFQVEKFDLFDLAQETVSELATIHGDRFEILGEPLSGFWNREAFKRAMENLLSNAIKYGAVNTVITVCVKNMMERAIFSVHNEGPSIPAEDQENLFQSFMRTWSARSSKSRGWGIGLAMVRGMAEGHGGSIAVDSAPGRGTTFLIDIPVDARPHLSMPITPGS